MTSPAQQNDPKTPAVHVEPCESLDHPGWLRFREALWPHAPRAEHLAEMGQSLALPERFVQFVAISGDSGPVGFVEGSLRSDYVNGTRSSPVGYLEGVYVTPNYRARGIGRTLIDAVAEWARERGCSELASDVPIGNRPSLTFHAKAGFTETERVVYFRRELKR